MPSNERTAESSDPFSAELIQRLHSARVDARPGCVEGRVSRMLRCQLGTRIFKRSRGSSVRCVHFSAAAVWLRPRRKLGTESEVVGLIKFRCFEVSKFRCFEVLKLLTSQSCKLANLRTSIFELSQFRIFKFSAPQTFRSSNSKSIPYRSTEAREIGEYFSDIEEGRIPSIGSINILEAAGSIRKKLSFAIRPLIRREGTPSVK